MNKSLLLGSREAEMFCVMKCLCDTINLSPEDIAVLPYIDTLEAIEYKSFKKTIRTIDVKQDLPEEIGSKKSSIFLFGMKPAIKSDPHAAEYRKFGVALVEFQITSPDKKRSVTYWRWIGERDDYPLGSWLYFVRNKDLFKFYRIILEFQRKPVEIEEPVLPAGMLHHIYENTIGFILRGHEKKEQYQKYHIPFRRGILLVGLPGCGKTLTCKWLKQLAIKNRIPYRIITLEAYLEAMERNNIRSLFRLPDKKGGLIFFDDLDQAVKNRESGNTSVSHFLTNLDGLETQDGAVCIFTSNYTTDLDHAFVRRGRIDVFVTFKKPQAQLRREFIEKKFDNDIKQLINIDELVDKSEDLTFAELEEIRKLLCMDMIDSNRVDLNKTLKTFELYKTEFENRLEIGFGKLSDGNDKWCDGDENMIFPYDDKKYS